MSNGAAELKARSGTRICSPRACYLASLLGAFALVLLAPSAQGGPACQSAQPQAGVPLEVGGGPADFGAVPEACGGNDVAIQGGGAALVALNDFYGSLHAQLAARFRLELSERDWISVWVPGLDYWYVANATITASSSAVGAGALGFHHAFAVDSALEVSPFARVLLPTEGVYLHGTRYGFDHGVSAVVRTVPWLELVGGVSFPLLIVDTAGTQHVTLLPSASADAAFEPWRFLAIVAGAGLRLRDGYAMGFESFDPRFGLRFYPWSGLHVELAAAFPLGGGDRTDALVAATLGFAWPGRAN